MAEFYTPIQSGAGNALAHFGQENFNPIFEDLEYLIYLRSGWYKLLDWVTLGTASALVTITGIDTRWRHLKLMGLFRSSLSATVDNLSISFSGASEHYYNSIRFHNSSTSTASGTAAAWINHRIAGGTAPAAPAIVYSPVIVDIFNAPASTSRYVMVRGYAHSTDTDSGMTAVLSCGEYRGETGAISSISLSLSSASNLTVGSMYALYGLDK